MKLKFIALILIMGLSVLSHAQVKILFDNVKGETSGTTADWTIDADLHDINWGTAGTAYVCGTCTHSDPQRTPTPAQSNITSTSPETTWTGALSSWGIDLVNQGYVVESLPYTGSITYGNSSNVQDLSHYKVFIMCEPNTHLTTAEKTALVSFVQNGGGLYMISDHNGSDRNFDGWDSPHIWMDFANTTSNVFGVIADTVTVSPTVTTLPNLPNDSCLHGPLGSVTGIKYHQGTTFTIYPSVNPSVVGVAYNSGTSGNTGVLAGHSRYGSGKVAFLGDSSPCDDGTGNPNSTLSSSYATDENGSHRKLLVNTTIWLATTDSTPAGLTVSASAPTTICAGGSVTLNASGATGYHWSPGGATSSSITVSPTITTTYTVSGTVSGATQTQTITVTVNNKPTPAFTTSILGSAVTVTNQSTNANSYAWSFGDGSAQVTGASPSAHTYTAAGNYTVMLITTNACGSDTATHSVTVSVLTLSPSGSTTICKGQSVTLTAAGASSYQWSSGGATSASITVTPTSTITYTVSGTVSGATETQTVTINVNNKPTPAFTTSLLGMALTVTNQSTGATTYSWNFGDGSASVSGASPSAHTYAGAGTYTVMLITSNTCGADTITHNVVVSVLTLSPSGNTSICQGQSVTLTASGASTYQWTPGGSTASSISVTPTVSTTYSVSGMVNGVSQTQSVTVTVNNKPTPQFSTSLAGMVLTVTDHSTNASSYTWDFGDGSTQVTGSAPSPHTYAATGTYTIIEITTNGCGTDTFSQTLTLNGLSLSPDGTTTICKGQSVTLTAAGASSYQWSPGGATTASVSVSPTSSTSYTVAGVINGVTQTQTVQVIVNDVPVPAFTESTSGRTVTVTDQSQHAASYVWYFGDGSATVSGSAPVPHTYSTNGTYTILLITTNGCGPDSTSQQVVINLTGITETDAPVSKIFQPNSYEVRIEYPQNNQDRDILIYNTSGQLIFNGKTDNFQSVESIDISSYATGVYIIRAGNSTKRFIR